jgi:ribosome recycling factor
LLKQSGAGDVSIAGFCYNKESNYLRGTMFDTTPYELKMTGALEHFEEELKKVRTGRAHPSMLDGIQAEAYGAKMPLNQMANVTAPEPQMLLVTPFDPGNIVAIVTAIRDDQSLGFNPSDDGRVIRVPVPALTEERRKQLVKQTSEKVEEARIALRNIRQDALKDAKTKKQSKELSEDDEKRVEKEIDKLMSDTQVKLDELFKAKEKDILTI